MPTTTSARPRILLLSIVNPEVERNGAATVTRGLLKVLSSPPLQADVDCVPVRIAPRRWHRLAQAHSLLESLISGLPSKVIFLRSREFRETVEARIRGKAYDLIVLNGSDLLWISAHLPPSIPRILVAHNMEHLLFRCQIQNLSPLHWPLSEWLRQDCQRLEEFEREGIRQARNAIFLSEDEAAYARGFCTDLQSVVMPPLFDYEPSIRPPKRTGAVLELAYLGHLGWWPNQLGLRWFLDRVLPHVKSPVRLHLFGHGGGRKWPGDGRVIEHGRIESLEQIWTTCDFLICPAVSSGGVRVKLAEAAYNGMPVLATTEAARGLGLEQDPALLFLDEPSAWVDLLNSSGARDLGERQVSAKIASRFALHTHTEPLQQFVRSVMSIQAGGAGGSR